ncbi:zinc finger protein 90 homolog isoform X2 [Cephus cinctus]|uniref:Zinc finger protein 90 homolog isoform X2 n=1 Tax=Cephus cinctus TaxID=211228 RepID=A0AAJ7BH32_CEPCN|nr:zinc finger protein 90 homolog isoform X2 [Cephus cinctus]
MYSANTSEIESIVNTLDNGINNERSVENTNISLVGRFETATSFEDTLAQRFPKDEEQQSNRCVKHKAINSPEENSVTFIALDIGNCTNLCDICNNDCRLNMLDKISDFECEVCKKKFIDQAKLNNHLRVHGKGPPVKTDKQFLCDVCSKTFASRTGLGFHLRTHTGYKPYSCQYCNKSFTISSNKIRHERTHTGDKHFVCHFCNTAFASSNGLKYHMTIHTGETNYHCKTCGKSFTRLKYLKEHNFTHTGERPFSCKICGVSYGNSGSLFVHEKKCKVQYSNCWSEDSNVKDASYHANQENNDIMHLKEFGDAEKKSASPCTSEKYEISYTFPQNSCELESRNQTNRYYNASRKPASVSVTSWHFKWSDTT